MLGTLAALIMVCPRVYYAMAKDGVFLSSVARTHPVHGTPSRAIMIQGVMSSILVLLGTFDQILGYLIFSAVLFLGLTVAGLFLLRRRSHDQLPIGSNSRLSSHADPVSAPGCRHALS